MAFGMHVLVSSLLLACKAMAVGSLDPSDLTSMVLQPGVNVSATRCVYVQSQNRITCGFTSCDTVVPGLFSEKLPVGTYRIAPNEPREAHNWHNLYPYVGGFYWDHFTKVARLGCRGGFALHGGPGSAGCVTIADQVCMERITKIIEETATKPFAVEECLKCRLSKCRDGIQELSERRPYKVDIDLVSQP